MIANYIRLLGREVRAHTASSADVDLNHLAIAAGLATVENGRLDHPYIGTRFGLAAVTTAFDIAPDRPLKPRADQPESAFGLAWKTGHGFAKNALNAAPYKSRHFVDGAHPFETLKRVDTPTTYIDEPNVPRVPKRTDMFARANFGDIGKPLKEGARNGHYVRKAPTAAAQRRALGAFALLQDGDTPPKRPKSPRRSRPTDQSHLLLFGCRCRRPLPLPRLDLVQPRCPRHAHRPAP